MPRPRGEYDDAFPDDTPPDDRFAALYASDLAAEVRSEFEDRVGFGTSVAEATAAVVQQFGRAMHDADNGPVILLALAALQLHHGQVEPAFRDAALELIDDGTAERAYNALNPGHATDRLIVLNELRTALGIHAERWSGEDGPADRETGPTDDPESVAPMAEPKPDVEGRP